MGEFKKLFLKFTEQAARHDAKGSSETGAQLQRMFADKDRLLKRVTEFYSNDRQ